MLHLQWKKHQIRLRSVQTSADKGVIRTLSTRCASWGSSGAIASFWSHAGKGILLNAHSMHFGGRVTELSRMNALLCGAERFGMVSWVLGKTMQGWYEALLCCRIELNTLGLASAMAFGNPIINIRCSEHSTIICLFPRGGEFVSQDKLS